MITKYECIILQEQLEDKIANLTAKYKLQSYYEKEMDELKTKKIEGQITSDLYSNTLRELNSIKDFLMKDGKTKEDYERYKNQVENRIDMLKARDILKKQYYAKKNELENAKISYEIPSEVYSRIFANINEVLNYVNEIPKTKDDFQERQQKIQKYFNEVHNQLELEAAKANLEKYCNTLYNHLEYLRVRYGLVDAHYFTVLGEINNSKRFLKTDSKSQSFKDRQNLLESYYTSFINCINQEYCTAKNNLMQYCNNTRHKLYQAHCNGCIAADQFARISYEINFTEGWMNQQYRSKEELEKYLKELVARIKTTGF